MIKMYKSFIFILTLFLCSSLDCHIFASGISDAYKARNYKINENDKYLDRINKKIYKIHFSTIKKLGNDQEKIREYIQNERNELKRIETWDIMKNREELKKEYYDIIVKLDKKLLVEKDKNEPDNLLKIAYICLALKSNYFNIGQYFRENKELLDKEKKGIKNLILGIIFCTCIVIIKTVIIILINIFTKKRLYAYLFSPSLFIDIVLICMVSKSYYFIYKMTPIIQLYNDVWRDLLG